MPRVRVMFLNDTARNGGPGRSLHSILSFLDPSVIHRTAVLPRQGPISDLLRSVAEDVLFVPELVENPIEPWERAMERSDFDAPALVKGRRVIQNVIKGGLALRALEKLVRRLHIDLIYCNGTNADFAGGAISWHMRVPSIWHVRYTSVPKIAAPIHDRLAASPMVRSIVCVSNAARSLFPADMQKAKVIHNALDTNAFAKGSVAGALRSRFGIAADAVIFGAHGRILARKGHGELVSATRLALDMLSPVERPKFIVAIVGDTPADIQPDHLAECRVLASELGLGENVVFTGFVSDVRPYLEDFDVGVVPSVYEDPLPRSVMEAMAYSVPVIAFDVGGVGEMLVAGTGALLDKAESRAERSSALASAMVRYFRDADSRARDGVRAREHITKEYDARAHAAAIQREILAAVGDA